MIESVALNTTFAPWSMATARLCSTAMAFTRRRTDSTMEDRAGTTMLRRQGATGRPQARKYVDGSAGPDYRNWGRDYAAEEWLDAAATAARALCQGQWTGPDAAALSCWPARLCSQRDGSSRIDTDVEASWEAHAARLKAAEITAVLADMEAIFRSTFSAEAGGEERHREQQDEEEEKQDRSASSSSAAASEA
eukprot:COSAG04_NODE_2189_length_4571_cov_2.027666_1_plen_193_part_00